MAHKVAKRYSCVTNVTMLVLSEHTMHYCVVCGHWPARPAPMSNVNCPSVCVSPSLNIVSGAPSNKIKTPDKKYEF